MVLSLHKSSSSSIAFCKPEFPSGRTGIGRGSNGGKGSRKALGRNRFLVLSKSLCQGRHLRPDRSAWQQYISKMNTLCGLILKTYLRLGCRSFGRITKKESSHRSNQQEQALEETSIFRTGKSSASRGSRQDFCGRECLKASRGRTSSSSCGDKQS